MSQELSFVCSQISDIEKALQSPEKLGSETEVYSRISGYYRSTRNWNAGKQSELSERQAYVV